MPSFFVTDSCFHAIITEWTLDREVCYKRFFVPLRAGVPQYTRVVEEDGDDVLFDEVSTPDMNTIHRFWRTYLVIFLLLCS